MIWIALLILVLGTLLVLAPAFVGEASDNSEEVADYFAQIDAVQADPDLSGAARDAARLQLERQILKSKSGGTQAGGRWIAGVTAVALLGGGLGLYAALGHPEPLKVEISETDSLLSQLEARLATDRSDDPVGWTIYARTLASIGRTEDAARAYDRALALDDNPELRAEAIRAIQGPDPDSVRDAQIGMAGMSEAERTEMIRGMVDGLSDRLAETPDNPQGWVRLIRARGVLGDDPAADIARMRTVYTERPEIAARIMEQVNGGG